MDSRTARELRNYRAALENALSELLKANADQMEKADQQIADNIPSEL